MSTVDYVTTTDRRRRLLPPPAPRPVSADSGKTWIYDHATRAMVWTAMPAGASDAAATVKGVTKLSTAPAVAADPIAIGDNDPRATDARPPTDLSVTYAKLTAVLAESLPYSIERVATRWYAPDGATGSAAPTAGIIYLAPFWNLTAFVIDQIAVNVSTLAASSVIHLGIYTTTGRFLDAGTVDSTTTGNKTIDLVAGGFNAAARTLPAGLLWFASLSVGGTPTITTRTSGRQQGHTAVNNALTQALPGRTALSGQTSLPAGTILPGAGNLYAPSIAVRAA